MAGVYFHIPFCKKRCRYCDFYSTIDLSKRKELVGALKKELHLRKIFLNDTGIKTVYFGGGTPSLLTCENISGLLQAVSTVYNVDKQAEITLEANPDDFSLDYLHQLKKTGVNRLSIGVQSFSDDDLLFLGRRHNALQAIEAIKYAQDAGFENISIDLIYGIPGMTLEKWEKNLETAFNLNIQHLSAYHLTYHENTGLWNDLKKGLFSEMDDDDSVKQFEKLVEVAGQHKFELYEISNLAKKSFYARHNSAYWDQTEYIGLGPSAHSYNTSTRYWNVSDISAYMKQIKQGFLPGESEQLGLNEKINDYLLTRLRTKWGVDLKYISTNFGKGVEEQLIFKAKPYIKNGRLKKEGNILKVPLKGIMLTDQIISGLFF
ncbi:MAG: radical SAM family heme chaperone HemW [Prolixibacteraceae bacterium]|nr:radical SAM family heme chaperone HemW [Prolixibacteraceae bacterium]